MKRYPECFAVVGMNVFILYVLNHLWILGIENPAYGIQPHS
jgi:hypothetical protein